jgi:hypothetical protein
VKYALTFFAGLSLGAWLLRAKDSSCCERLSYGARDKIAGYAGPAAPLVAGALDATGLTKLLPRALDLFGVPKDA